MSAEEYFSEEVQRQVREFKDKNNGMYAWYRMQNAIERARRFRIYHDKMENWTMPNLFDEKGDAIDWYHTNDPEQRQLNMIKKNLLAAKRHRHSRGRLSNLRLRLILRGIVERRAERYLNPEKYMKKNILCIVGQSGSGKTLASLHLQNFKGANVVCSFTTRPPRETEVEGREHHFIDIVPDRTELLAYTHFGGHYYYALKDQVYGSCTVYVIDEKGLKNLKRDNGDDYNIFSVYIKRNTQLRRKCGVKVSRMRRDERRERIDESEYDYVIENNSTKVHLFDEIERIYDEVCSKQTETL